MLSRSVLFLTLLISSSVADENDFRPKRIAKYSRYESDKFDDVVGGKCSASGCTSGKTQPRFCYPPISVKQSLQVEDETFEDGVNNCAQACKNLGLKENETEWESYPGKYECNSFDYRPTKETNCLLYGNPPTTVLGTRPGSTRVDFTEYYCYQRDMYFPRNP